jgi:hypothetical protein
MDSTTFIALRCDGKRVEGSDSTSIVAFVMRGGRQLRYLRMISESRLSTILAASVDMIHKEKGQRNIQDYQNETENKSRKMN